MSTAVADMPEDDGPPKPPAYAAPAAFTEAAAKSARARSKFTEDRKNKVLAALQGGHMDSTAAALAGIGVQTLRDWLRQGNTDMEAGVESDYAAFTEKAMQCVATAEARAVAVVMGKAMNPGPEQLKAAQWYLERRHSENWGKTERIDVNHQQDGPVVIQLEWPGARHTVAPALEAGSDDDDIVDAEVVEDTTVEPPSDDDGE